ncbi:MAG TPA: alkaline phosphatase D family protein [Pyrinomonadaceae bacterium]|jgi:alkaline phosphatase D|nr:alkaline phosphatase D family protein [Pyrinomonadaceae bacterium]
MSISRRTFIELAASFGASLAFKSTYARASNTNWRERRDLYPQGVASGDPHSDSVILWTRRPPANNSEAIKLTVEIADDEGFRRVVATAHATLSSETDWTTRVLAAGLKPRTVYWYRFTDEFGFGSRVGRTITAPAENDSRPVSFAFVSCQNMQMGGANAYRRMIWEDERKPVADQLGFVLHLGDFVYEVVWYPEDRPQGYNGRRLRDVVRYPHGEKIRDFHVPVTVDDYRVLYRGYLLDPELQDARARWPFVCMWDNHEFSWKGWQSQQEFSGVRPAQTRKVAANQAWFEYQPARVIKSNPDRDSYTPPAVRDTQLREFDDHGLGLEQANLDAINSLKIYRTLRWGRNVELILTDNRSYRSEPAMHRAEAAAFQPQQFPFVFSENVVDVFDGGRDFNHGKPPDAISFNGASVANPRKQSTPQSMLGVAQKAWFLEKLRASSARWKLWGNSVAMGDWRIDFQNLPESAGAKWPDSGYATLIDDDWSAYRHERAEVLDYIRSKQITGVVAVCGDRHAFEAGLISPSLPPKTFEPVIAEFVTGSISAPGLFEAAESSLPKEHPLRAIYLYQPSADVAVQPAVNFSMMHGVRASLALKRTGDARRALEERNPQLAPHLSFVDLGGHGYSVVRADSDELEVEFVCIVRPLERSERADGGPLAYRVVHRLKRWTHEAAPQIERTKVEGTLPLIL